MAAMSAHRPWMDRWFELLNARFEASADELGRLDGQVGDGDHGETMRRAFAAVYTRLFHDDREEPQVDADRLRLAGTTILDAGGGASGPLMASLFLGIAQATEEHGALNAQALARGLDEASRLVVRMGRTEVGDKTLLDALQPAAREAGRAATHSDDLRTVWQAAVAAAEAGRDATAAMAGRRGRSAWVEGYGKGTQDPGATSITLILKTGLEALTDAADATKKAPKPHRTGQASTPGAARIRNAPAGKLLHSPDTAVSDMLDGLAAAFPARIKRLGDDPIAVRASRAAPDKVGLVIGNGSGHEPIAVGWVGRGMLDANALGPIFTAPSPNLIARAIAASDQGSGVLLLISHHEGDRIAGEMAAHLARMDGHRVETLLMYDDVASAPKGQEANRRGGAGTAFVYKIVGQALEEGMRLEEAKRLGERIRDATRTLSVALAPGTSPVDGEALFSLPPGEAFIGMGVHGEPGFARMPADHLANICEAVLDGILDDGGFPPGATLIPFVNGSGGTSLMELLVVSRFVLEALGQRGFNAVHPLIGSYVTTQETKGFSVSVFHVSEDLDVRRWRAAADVPFFHL